MLLPISRRDFFKLAGAAAVGTLLSDRVEPSRAMAASGSTIRYADRDIPLLFDADVCVCGGGPAGTAAAINAARNGVSTVLIEKGIALGGLAVLGCVYPMMGVRVSDCITPYIKEIGDQLVAHGINLGDNAGQNTMWFNPEVLSEIYDDLCAEAGVDVLYNATLVDAITDGNRITTALVQTIGGLFAINAKIFIDATGDAYLTRAAGVPTKRGSLKTGRNQHMSFRFEMGGIDIKKLYKFIVGKLHDEWSSWAKLPYLEIAKTKKTAPIFEGGLARGELEQEDLAYFQAFTVLGKSGTMSMNLPQLPSEYSATDAISYSQAVSHGRAMMRRMANFLIKNMPGFKSAYISREAAMLGARESWRIRGKYLLTEEDYYEQSRFPDAVARTAYPIDIHDVDLELRRKFPKGGFYEVPYRALVTNLISNLAVAGRCISADFAAQASVRTQLTCMSMGEAAGIASAYALKNNIAVKDVQWDRVPNRSYVSQPK